MATSPISAVNDMLTRALEKQMSTNQKLMKMNVTDKVQASKAGVPQVDDLAKGNDANKSSGLDLRV